jgi:hypothetical protein
VKAAKLIQNASINPHIEVQNQMKEAKVQQEKEVVLSVSPSHDERKAKHPSKNVLKVELEKSASKKLDAVSVFSYHFTLVLTRPTAHSASLPPEV